MKYVMIERVLKMSFKPSDLSPSVLDRLIDRLTADLHGHANCSCGWCEPRRRDIVELREVAAELAGARIIVDRAAQVAAGRE
jgi:hypothetical protein